MMNRCNLKDLTAKEILPISLIFLMFAVGIVLYNSMPEEMPTHWDAKGKIDGYGSRFIGLFLLPIITLCIYLLLSAIPGIAVYKKNIKKFYFYYFGFKIVFVFFMLALYIISLLPNFGFEFNMNHLLMPLVGILIFFSGILAEKSKKNYFIGIRTPWTLASDRVWEKTNKLGGRGFKIIGVMIAAFAFFGAGTLYLSFGLLILFAIFLFIYSYVIFKNEN